MKNKNTQPNEKQMQAMSRGLAHLIFRNGIVEELHAGKSTVLDDKTMEILNRDVNNRIYTCLKLLFSNDEDRDVLYRMISNESVYGKSWDPAKISDDLGKYIEHIKNE